MITYKEAHTELIIIRSWLDEKELITKAKQKLTNLIKKLEEKWK